METLMSRIKDGYKVETRTPTITSGKSATNTSGLEDILIVATHC
jgi:hypothetical protein